MKTLYLTLKKQWYDMIERGEKLEEYREIKPYWEKRLIDYAGLRKYYAENRKELLFKQIFFPHRPVIENIMSAFSRGYEAVRFSYGYTRRTMTFEVVSIDTGIGRPEWGAPDTPVFIIKLGKRITKNALEE